MSGCVDLRRRDYGFTAVHAVSDLVDRLREVANTPTELSHAFIDHILLDAAAEIVRVRLRLSDLETSIAAFRQTVNEWEF